MPWNLWQVGFDGPQANKAVRIGHMYLITLLALLGLLIPRETDAMRTNKRDTGVVRIYAATACRIAFSAISILAICPIFLFTTAWGQWTLRALVGVGDQSDSSRGSTSQHPTFTSWQQFLPPNIVQLHFNHEN